MAQLAPNRYFATSPRGLEQLLADELQQVGAKSIKSPMAVVSFDGDWVVCLWRQPALAHCHTHFVQVGRGKYANEEDLFNAAYKLNWPQWFEVKHDFMVKVTGVKCPLKSLEFVT